MLNKFLESSKAFSLTISLSKTEALYQPVPNTTWRVKQLETHTKACQTARDLSHACPSFHTWHVLARPHHKPRGPGPCWVYQHWNLTHQGPAAMGGTNHQNGRSSHAPSTAVWRTCARYKDTEKTWGFRQRQKSMMLTDPHCSHQFRGRPRHRLMAGAYERSQRTFSADITTTEFQCPTCSRLCASRLGLQSHQRIRGWSHNTQSSSDTMDNHQTSTFKRGVLSKVAPHFIVTHLFR